MAQKCVHQGCGKEYTDAAEKCEYHPGPPVFHEGQKGKHGLNPSCSYAQFQMLTWCRRMEMLQAPGPDF